jgi:hypothetical protein
MHHLTMLGVVVAGQTWVSRHWERMLAAHPGELDAYETGTLNIDLYVPGDWDRPLSWEPPRDEELSRSSHVKGVALLRKHCHKLGMRIGADFLNTGNYLHPDIVVTKIERLIDGVLQPNNVDVAGRVYYPGAFEHGYYGKMGKRTRIEVVSAVHLRAALSLETGHRVQATLQLTAPSPAPAGSSLTRPSI